MACEIDRALAQASTPYSIKLGFGSTLPFHVVDHVRGEEMPCYTSARALALYVSLRDAWLAQQVQA